MSWPSGSVVQRFGAFCSVCYSYMVHDQELVRSVVFCRRLLAFLCVFVAFAALFRLWEPWG